MHPAQLILNEYWSKVKSERRSRIADVKDNGILSAHYEWYMRNRAQQQTLNRQYEQDIREYYEMRWIKRLFIKKPTPKTCML